MNIERTQLLSVGKQMLYRIPIVGKHKGKFTEVSEEDYRKFCHLPLFLSSGGYVVYINNKNEKISLHRTIMKGVEEPSTEEGDLYCDHIDRNKLNNTRANFHWTTPYLNSLNRSKQAKPASSKYKGVSWHKHNKKWQVRLVLDKGENSKSLGYYDDEHYAGRVYNFHVQKYFIDKGMNAFTNELTV